jgi:glutaryl-CoA dehydrogenase
VTYRVICALRIQAGDRRGRDLLGGDGVLLENHVIRHVGDIAVIHTYEGTGTMQILIVGRDITGVGGCA